ncbi:MULTISPECIES: NAD(+) diphosphatase [unclassified Microbacterium]|uniref:NAD(+) diphosphatase n=1 Tax=unclassified Microbacterium TaxID=2609290 RepID=UPI00214CB2EC|nr:MULTISPECIES: NAD(+) diphosphatase [unclassified Microbacterium]MCR2809789.1 NAD(+) diphosphatase [Microbacterium sp. zg.B185]WIM17900.1 NAD(+) diphosphatase [Microbacterium sp. zg-B185]
MTAPDSTRSAPLARPGFDRAAHERADPDLLESARLDDATRVLVLNGDTAPLAAPDSLHWVAPAAVPSGAEWAFLGRTATGAAALVAVFARGEEDLLAAPAGWAPLRVVGGSLTASDAGAFVEALSLGRWLLEAPFCPACGARTQTRSSGWSRHCPSCGREHFPRTDPAVIVAVTSATHPDRLLLGSNALWAQNRFSCFAGFVEAGESLESAVVREVREEAGVDLVDVQYRSSQAWPYPRSLMLGFLAVAADDAAAEADGEEILAVRWFERAEIGASLRGEGDLILPGSASIAHQLISEWYASAP